MKTVDTIFYSAVSFLITFSLIATPVIADGSIVYDANESLVLISGTTGEDACEIANVDADNIRVTLVTASDSISETFETPGVARVLFIGSDGDDVVTNFPAVPLGTFGGNGKDRLESVYARAFLSGGPGDDSLFGGQESDDLWGNAGFDVLVGNAGADFLQGGTENDVLVGGIGSRGQDGLSLISASL